MPRQRFQYDFTPRNRDSEKRSEKRQITRTLRDLTLDFDWYEEIEDDLDDLILEQQPRSRRSDWDYE